jgi:hypothetical protein
MIPLISSCCYGPLGVCQLPRFWWKVLLKKTGLMDEEYPDCSGGLDTWVLERLELDKDETLGYLRSEMPDFLTFEAWVLDKKGGELDYGVVGRWNASVRNRVHGEKKIAETLANIGISDEGSLTSAVILNSLEDWQLFYSRDMDTGFEGVGSRVVPLVASIDYGALEICQLPRVWEKVILKAKGVLHPEYPDFTQGLDAGVVGVLGLGQDAVLAYLREQTPSYVAFEAWVLEQKGGQLDRQAVAEWNDYIRNRIHKSELRKRILDELALPDNGQIRSAVVLNQIEDWHIAHKELVAGI